MSNVTKLDIDIAPVTLPVRIGELTYALKTASSRAVTDFKAKLLSLSQVGDDGKIKSIGPGVVEAELELLSQCLHFASINDKGILVEVMGSLTLEEVGELPNVATKRLLERLKEISGLTVPVEEGGEKAENPSTS